MDTPFRATVLATKGSFFALAMLVSAVATAATPRVSFDAASVVACRDVTPPNFADEYPGEKLIEAEFVVTTRLTQGSLHDVYETSFQISSPGRRLRVLDYWPTTRYESDIEGTIDVTETFEKSHSAGASFVGSISTPDLPVKGVVKPSANLGNSHRETKSEKYERVAPKRTVLVSGTTRQGHGLFIKRLASKHSSLEGSEPIICRLIVPEQWQGDWIEIVCHARGRRKTTFGKTTGIVGAANISAGMFLTGNREARNAATRLSDSQARAEAWRHEMQNKSELSLAADQIAISFDSLACNMKLGRCSKHRRNKTRITPQQTFISDRRLLAELAGEPTEE